MFGDIMFWTGVVTWVALCLLGLSTAIDTVFEWTVDSVRFKAYVVGYLANRKGQ